jgi:hypothetical protein
VIHPLLNAIVRGRARRRLAADHGKSFAEAVRLVDDVSDEEVEVGAEHLAAAPPVLQAAGFSLLELLSWIAAHKDQIAALVELVVKLALLFA